jgi:Periplasmic lysozyme inhibitor of I-type lysozyme
MRHCLLSAASAASLALAGALLVGNALAGERFAHTVTIQPGLVAVVSEGDFEARSIGSYSVRVYFDPNESPGNETAFYSAGLIRARDGTVRSAAPLEVPGRKRPLLMVVVQSAGSGGYLSADAFDVEPHSVRLVASVGGLAPDEDPAARLRRRVEGAER